MADGALSREPRRLMKVRLRRCSVAVNEAQRLVIKQVI
jgi:hypothetical protein